MIQPSISLPIMEAFYTIQGEGYHTGKAAYFIRIAGCDVGCHWCDVKESWPVEGHPVIPIKEIVLEAQKHGNLVVITGGEPLMWNLTTLTQQLQKAGMQTNIETSGAYELSGSWDWICLSPKKNVTPKDSVYAAADELKCIIYNKHDFIFAEEQAKKVNSKAKLYLQVEWSKREQMLPLLIDYVKNNPKWCISTQTHKYMNIP